MNTLLSMAIALRDDRSGATAIEYSLLAALIALAIIGAVASLGQTLDTLYPRIESYLAGSAASTP